MEKPLEAPTGAALVWARIRFAWVFAAFTVVSLLMTPFYYLFGYPFSRYFYSYVQSWAYIFSELAGCRTFVKGLSRPDWDEPAVIVMNHLSYLDFAVAMQVVPVRLHIIAMKSLAYVPFVGGAMRLMRFIFIDRKSTEKAYGSIARAAEKVAAGRCVLSYPEGGISRDGHMRSFKRGLFALAVQAQVPVIPLVIRGSDHVMDNWKKWNRPGRVEVEFLAPEPTVGLTEDDLPALMERVRNRMVESYGDGSPRGEGRELAPSAWDRSAGSR